MTINIRPASDNDKEKILELLNNVFKDQQRSDSVRGEKYWNWKFITSPYGRSLTTVAEMDNEIIGVDNLWPWEFKIRGNVYKAYQPCDSVVHSKARGKGVFKNMRLHGLDIIRGGDSAFVFNFPNNQSLHANLSLGWHYMGQVPWIVRIIKPVSILRGIIEPGKSESLPIIDDLKLNYDALESLDESNLNYDSCIHIHRKKGYFNWRYSQHPNRHYGMISCKKGSHAASAIFTVNQRSTYKEMVIVEIVGSPKITGELLRSVIMAAKEMDVGILALMNNSSYRINNLWQLGFLKKKAKNMAVLPLNLCLEPLLKSYNNWSLFACLHDSV